MPLVAHCDDVMEDGENKTIINRGKNVITISCTNGSMKRGKMIFNLVPGLRAYEFSFMPDEGEVNLWLSIK